MITIVIPFYNASEHILKCIKSLNSQTNKNFEVIFVDDASTDNTVEIIEKSKKNITFNFSLIQCKKNVGPAIARNLAIEKTSTEYITFCDSDDWYDDRYIELMYENLKFNNCDIVFCGYKVVSENGNIEERKIVGQSIVHNSKEALIVDVDSLCMMMVKTAIMKKYLLPDIRNGEDMAVIPLLIIEARRCVFLDMCLYNYFRRNNSASQKVSIAVVYSLCESFDYIFENIDNYKKEIEYIGVRNIIYATLINLFSITYDKKLADRIIKEFESRFPNWKNNEYISGLPFYKKIVVKMAKQRLYLGIYFLAKIRTHIHQLKRNLYERK